MKKKEKEKHNMSNLETNTAVGGFFQPQFAPSLPPLHDHQPPPPSASKKRSLPGNPDPDAEVIALSPPSLQATNRFLCEICNKGFQRDQNLQLHRRGHNLPWKLKQRCKGEVVRKKVYVCPEPSCVHHHPSRALGDLTGIKKHYFRKHGEKKWKCDKCNKRYAVQSDWKAHAKVCGTREYKCECGTIFSRRDSFITHRAFCDALAQETYTTTTLLTPQLHQPTHLPGLSIKRELQDQLQQHLFNPAQFDLFFSDPTFQNQQTRSHAPFVDQMGPTFPFPSEEAMSMGGGNGFFDHANGQMMGPAGVLEGLYSNGSPFYHDGSVGLGFGDTPNIHNREETTSKLVGKNMTRDFLGLKDVSGFDLMRKSFSTSSADPLRMNNNGGKQVMKEDKRVDQKNDDDDQYTYFGRGE